MHDWKKENKFIIATGRSKKEAIEILKRNNLDFDYLITNNGAILYDKNQNILIEKQLIWK
ncbi:HAD family hydrolase [Spiroplasma taiwanense]|uniref:HAD family hydrolase n=1 Tax=Spiroplasma taiwanense TaxID=2145 RepID=UPI0038CD1119